MITHFTVGYPVTREMVALGKSSRKAGMSFRSLPASAPSRKIHFLDKFELMAQMLSAPEIGNSDLILFTDAYDVCVLETSETIASRFLRLDTDLLFNGEKNFWPTLDPIHVEKYRPMFSAIPGVAPYLNSGCYVGYAWAVRQMLTFCLEIAHRTGLNDDQALAQIFWAHAAETGNIKVSVDSTREVFGTIVGSHDDYELFGSRLYDRSSGKSVCVLHLNGNRNALDFIPIWDTLYGCGEERLFDLRLPVIGDRKIAIDKESGNLQARTELSRDCIISIHKQPGMMALLAGSGSFITSLPSGKYECKALEVSNWEVFNTRSLSDFHGSKIRITGEEMTADGTSKLTFKPLTIDIILRLQLLQSINRIVAAFR